MTTTDTTSPGPLELMNQLDRTCEHLLAALPDSWFSSPYGVPPEIPIYLTACHNATRAIKFRQPTRPVVNVSSRLLRSIDLLRELSGGDPSSEAAQLYRGLQTSSEDGDILDAAALDTESMVHLINSHLLDAINQGAVVLPSAWAHHRDGVPEEVVELATQTVRVAYDAGVVAASTPDSDVAAIQRLADILAEELRVCACPDTVLADGAGKILRDARICREEADLLLNSDRPMQSADTDEDLSDVPAP